MFLVQLFLVLMGFPSYIQGCPDPIKVHRVVFPMSVSGGVFPITCTGHSMKSGKDFQGTYCMHGLSLHDEPDLYETVLGNRFKWSDGY